MVFGNMGEKLRDRGCLYPQSHRPAKISLYGEFLVNAQGEDVVAGIRTPQDITEKRARIEAGSTSPSLGSADARGICGIPDHIVRRLEAPLQGHAGPGVHDREGQTLDAPDPRGKTHREGSTSRLRSIWLLKEGVITGKKKPIVAALNQRRSGSAFAPHDRPGGGARHRDIRPAGLAGGGFRGNRVHVRRSREKPKAEGRKTILVRVETSPEDIHGMHAAEGYPDQPWWHDQPCGCCRARNGQAVRCRLPVLLRIDYRNGVINAAGPPSQGRRHHHD